MKKKSPRDYFDWRRILNTYRHIEDITDEDWRIIDHVLGECFIREKKDEDFLKAAQDFFELIISLTSSDISLGETDKHTTFTVAFEILYLGNPLNLKFGIEIMRDLFAYYHSSLFVVKEITAMLVEVILRKIGRIENDF